MNVLTNSLKFSGNVNGASVIVLDDVVVTGSTFQSAENAIRKASTPAEILLLAVAETCSNRAVHNNPKECFEPTL